MRITLRALRFLIKEDYYNLDASKVVTKWPVQHKAAIEYVAKNCGVKDLDAAASYLNKYWTWDTLEHEGKPVLLARDENTRVAMAFHPAKGQWYKRVSMSDPIDCERVGEEEDSSKMKKAASSDGGRPSTGTMISGPSGEGGGTMVASPSAKRSTGGRR